MATQLIVFKRCKNTTRYGKKMILFIQGYQTCHRQQVPTGKKLQWRAKPFSTLTNLRLYHLTSRAYHNHQVCFLIFFLLRVKSDMPDVSSGDTNKNSTIMTTNNKLVDPEKVKYTHYRAAPCFVIFQQLNTVHMKNGEWERRYINYR